MSDPIRVLFIGNSYIYVNNLPGLLTELSAHEARPIQAEMVVEGGATLLKHWADGIALPVLQRSHWDFVVLQEQSTLGVSEVIDGIDQISDPANFYAGVRLFDDVIQQAGAKTLLYLTWARQNAPQMQALLTHAYTSIAQERGAQVVPIGPAWMRALSAQANLPFYQDDGSHPEPAGSYFAACVFYAALYGKSPQGLSGKIFSTLVDALGVDQTGEVNLSPAEALFLQQIAWQIIAEQPSAS